MKCTIFRIVMLISIVVGPSAQAAKYYWDSNGTSNGFGVASGIWETPTPGPLSGWSTDTNGMAVIHAVTTTVSDAVYFGTDTNGLGAGTVHVAGTQRVANLYFGQASADITLSGGTLSFPGGDSFIRSPTSWGSMAGTHTINSAITKAGGTLWLCNQTTAGEKLIFNGVISGPGHFDVRPHNYDSYIALNASNTFSSSFSHVTGQVNVNTIAKVGVAQSLGTGAVYSMGGGGGQAPLLWYTGTEPGSTDKEIRSHSNGDNRIVAQHGVMTLAGPLKTTSAGTYNFFLCGTADTGTNTVSGTISDGSGTINVGVRNTIPQGGSGEEGYWVFSGSNTYSGSTLIEAGTLVADHAYALGHGGIIDFNGGTLRYTANSAGTDWSTRFANSTLAIQLDTHGESVTLTNTISGSNTAGLTKLGAGRLTIVDGFTYGGGTTVDGGTLKFRGTSGAIQATPGGSSVINNGATWELEDTGSDNRISFWDETVTFGPAGGGTIDFIRGNFLMQVKVTYETLGGTKNTITSSGAPGAAHLNMQSSTMIFDVADGPGAIDLGVTTRVHGNPTTAGTVIKNGAGVLEMTYNGNAWEDTTINAGTLLVNGRNTGSGTASVNDGGALGGTGTVASAVSLSSGGHLAPGSGGVGTLTLSQGLTLNDGAVLDVDVNSGSGSNDLVMVTGGTVTGSGVDGVTVNVLLSGAPTGSYAIMDWSAAASSGLEFEDFDVVCGGGSSCGVQVTDTQLVLHFAKGLLFSIR